MGVCEEERSKRKIDIVGNKEIRNELHTGLHSQVKDEVFTGHKPIPVKIVNKLLKSICKIIIKTKEDIGFGTGFFLNYSDDLKYLLTNYHIINPSLEDENIEIEIYNQKKMKLEFKNRIRKYMEQPKDISIIEIKESDEIYKDIEFLDYDLNYEKKGYIIYKGADIFSIEHPYGEDASCASGRVVEINDFEFDHNISTDNGSSGCPILLLNNNINFIRVIGIHKNGDYSKKLNGGTFIAEIFNEDLNLENKLKKNNENIKSQSILSSINDKINNIQPSEEELIKLFKEYPALNDGVIVKVNGPVKIDNSAYYFGEWDFSKNFKHGRGIQYFKSGAKYLGYFTENKANIKGKLIHEDGDIYEGEYLNDMPNGRGKYIHSDGTIYEGEWKSDKLHGKGKEKWKDGTFYEGDYVNGLKHGKGKLIWNDGSSYEGYFKEGNINGYGYYIYADGRTYKGTWLDNKLNGNGLFTWPDGRKYEGEYKNDKKEGFGIFYLSNGKIYKGNWKNGKQHGEGEFYFPNDDVWKKGYWENGKRIKWY